MKTVVLVLLGLPILALLVLVALDRRAAGDPLLQPVIALIGCLIPLGIVLFLWAGPFGLLWKLTEFFSLFSIITYAAVQPRNSRPTSRATRHQRFRVIRQNQPKLVAVALVAACVLGPVTYLTDPLTPDSYLSFQEVAGAKWIASRAGQSDVVFTDLRLASPMIALGFLPLLILFSVFSCKPDEDIITRDSGAKLEFATDTVFFDTVFVSTGSVTKRLTVYT